jgi:hypothetical protein
MTLIATPRTPSSPYTVHDLATVVRRVASVPQLWRPKVQLATDHSAVRLPGPDGVDVRLLTWLPTARPGSSDGGRCVVDLHAHDDASAAFAVVEGVLTEVRDDDVLGRWTTLLQAPAVRVVERGIVHSLRNEQTRVAVSIHAYGRRP